MAGQTIILTGPRQRAFAHQLVEAAPVDAVLNIKEGTRNLDQNALMWAALSDISRAKPEGRCWRPEVWKCAFMHALGHQVQFADGLDGAGPFPIGFRSSRLSKREMADLITTILEYGDRNGVRWSKDALE